MIVWAEVACPIAPNRRASDTSGAAESNLDLAVLFDHGHGAAAEGELEHALQRGVILFDVDVLERDVPPLIVVTGGLCIGSTVLAVDLHHASYCTRAPSSSARVSSPRGIGRPAA